MIEHHILSPHRDDAILTFGGFALSRVAAGEKVQVHILNGIDGYMRDSFVDELLTMKLAHPHLQRLAEIMQGDSAHLFNQVQEVSSLKDPTPQQRIILGRAIRSLEERSVAKSAGFSLVEYDLRTGYPLRGYPRFNSPLVDADVQKQLDIHLAGKVGEDDQHYAETLGIKHPHFGPVLNAVLNGENTHVYAPAGVGGHPDHLIASRIATIIESRYPNISVSFGQDLPYSLVTEWFQKAHINFDDYDKTIIDISPFLEHKIALLQLYQSQLSDEDLRLASIYPRYTAEMISHDFPLAGIAAVMSNPTASVEIQYQKAK